MTSKSTPSRRITPTPVKAGHDKPLSPFSSGTFVSSPLSSQGDSSLSPTSLQEERNMLKAMKSKRRSKGDSPWGNKTSPHNNSGYRSPSYSVLGDFIACSPGNTQKTKSGQAVNGEVDSVMKAKPVNNSMQQRKNVELKVQSENDSTKWKKCNGFSEQDERKLQQNGEMSNEITKEEQQCSSLPVKMDMPINCLKNTVELGKVTFKDKLNLLGKLHATLILGENEAMLLRSYLLSL